jgi:hypothetical protein
VLWTRRLLGAGLLLVGALALAHAKRRRDGLRYRSNEPIPGWIYGFFGYRLALESPTEGHLEREGVIAQALAAVVALCLGLAFLLVQD